MTEAFHLLKNLVDVWHHVLAVHHDRLVGAVPQSHMEHGAALRVQEKKKKVGGNGISTVAVSNERSNGKHSEQLESVKQPAPQ